LIEVPSLDTVLVFGFMATPTWELLEETAQLRSYCEDPTVGSLGICRSIEDVDLFPSGGKSINAEVRTLIAIAGLSTESIAEIPGDQTQNAKMGVGCRGMF
jgi:hypothetical protein